MLVYHFQLLKFISCVKRFDHESHFAWQALYLVRLEDDTCCSAHSKLRFMCEEV